MLLPGLDVSDWNEVDWPALRRAHRDIAFGYRRTAEWRQAGGGVDEFGQARHARGGLLDERVERDLREMAGCGIVPGVYQRAYPSLHTPEHEAAQFAARIRLLGAHGRGWLWPMIDVEEPRDLRAWIAEFLVAYSDLSPTSELVFYASSSYVRKFYSTVLAAPPLGLRMRLCVAHTERYSTPAGLPTEEWAGRADSFGGLAALHQYTHTGRLTGITGAVDRICLMPGVRLADVCG